MNDWMSQNDAVERCNELESLIREKYFNSIKGKHFDLHDELWGRYMMMCELWTSAFGEEPPSAAPGEKDGK